jgi:hypothetical protein
MRCSAGVTRDSRLVPRGQYRRDTNRLGPGVAVDIPAGHRFLLSHSSAATVSAMFEPVSAGPLTDVFSLMAILRH